MYNLSVFAGNNIPWIYCILPKVIALIDKRFASMATRNRLVARVQVFGGVLLQPIIGITGNVKDETRLTASMNTVRSITKAGGTPVVLPIVDDRDVMARFVDVIDGLVLSGGMDVDPTLYGEEPHPKLGKVSPERDFFEINIARAVLDKGKPLLGICRGCQVLNVSLGGTLFQDIHAQSSQPLLQHVQQAPRYHGSHFAEISNDSKLKAVVGQERIRVNSFHHQAVKEVGRGLVVSAVASDGVVEAVESTEHPFVIGVQWHPEHMALHDDEPSNSLFRAFVSACSR